MRFDPRHTLLVPAVLALCVVLAAFAGRAAACSSRSASASSSCAIALSSFSEERPNCIRRSFASCAFSRAISLPRSTSSCCWRAIVAACEAISARAASGRAATSTAMPQ